MTAGAIHDEAARDLPDGSGDHIYLSTSCLHGHHDHCDAMVGTQGEKRPATCKWCEARCICECHLETP